MKIAFVGKGGSGKSTISWLAVKTLEHLDKNVLAIDADHNMDLTSNLGVDPEHITLMHQTDREFMEATGLKNMSEILSSGKDIPSFTFSPKDKYTEKIATQISKNVSLINIGLGSPDIIFQDKCPHGLSGPLKYYLGLLDEKDDFVVIDSVAGADMINYGLYAGIDAVIGVVEPHRNSVKVFEQISDICRRTFIPCFVIINKPTDNEFYQSINNTFDGKILGEINLDENLMNYDFSKLKKETIKSMENILLNISKLNKRKGLDSIKTFNNVKSSGK